MHKKYALALLLLLLIILFYSQAVLEPFVFEWTIAAGGSISAEHGLGQSKAAWLPKAKPPAVVEVMRGLKRMLDPDGVLNPGKVLPPMPL